MHLLPFSVDTGCKINASLRIGNLLPNGYHELETIFVPLTMPSDTLTITKSTRKDGLAVTFNNNNIDLSNNTLSKAYNLFYELTNFKPAIDVSVTKRVPLGAGLGGGSANAAGLLNFLNAYYREYTGKSVDKNDLIDIASKTGADVPFFIDFKPSFARGIGHILEPLANPFKDKYIVLVCPDVTISTSWAFKSLDEVRNKSNFSLKKDLTSSELRYISIIAPYVGFGNDFEEVILPNYPTIAKIKEELILAGAEFALLSGSGSSIFGIFNTFNKANVACELQRNNGCVYMQKL